MPPLELMPDLHSDVANPIPESSRGPLIVAAAVLLLHALTNGRYGFHRDELATLSDASHLSWGFVAYPPLTPFFGRVSLSLFGVSVAGARVFASLAQAVAILCGGWIARELGGRRFAQTAAALAVAIAPVSLAAGGLLQYVTFDYLWWVLVALFTIRMLRTGNPRYWIAIGAVIGLGMMTKYSMLFLVTGLLTGLALTPGRKLLNSRWLWSGIAVALLILLPNAVWQIQHHFISLDFLKYIHARDVRIGRTKGFLVEQFYVTANLFTVPLWLAGLWFYLRSKDGRWCRAIGWMFLVTFALFAIGRGRGYYMAPAYPMLLAAGALLLERWSEGLSRTTAVRATVIAIWIASGVLMATLLLPLAPIGSRWFAVSSALNGDLVEEFGWKELTAEVARIYQQIPPQDRTQTGILTGNYGEAGALELYGGEYGLPAPLSGTNSFWLRGYGSNPPTTLIVLGIGRDSAERIFAHCSVAGHNGNAYGIRNEESVDHPDILLCDGMRYSWPDFWAHFRRFG